jgi:hypothetical protein
MKRLICATVLGIATVGAATSQAGPHSLMTTRSVGSTTIPAVRQFTGGGPGVPRPTLPSAFVMPDDGNFQAPVLDRTKPMYVPSFNSTFSTPTFAEPSVGHLTRNGTELKETNLRTMSLDPSLRSSPTITAGQYRAAIRTAPERSTNLAPGRDEVRDTLRPNASYGPAWLSVELEAQAPTPHDGRRPGLQTSGE